VLSCLDKAGTIAERDNDRYGRLTKCIRIKGGGIARGYVINPAALLAATEE
jgi:putative DNA primase/helicase